MKIKFSKHTSPKTVNRLKKKIRIRKVVNGSEERPRLCVFRSAKHIYAQIINDVNHSTVLTVSSLNLDSKSDGKETAKQVGIKIAQEFRRAQINTLIDYGIPLKKKMQKANKLRVKY